MDRVFESLPGQEVPVGEIAARLAALWAAEPGASGEGPSEFRASQMNLVLHLGRRVDPEDAAAQLATLVAFSQRHPCRALVLCPLPEEAPETAMRAKVYSECYIGQSRREMSCCEVVVLSYPFAARAYLENQVSVCLETDLPLYYWAHGIASGRRLADYRYLLQGARRIVVDSASEPAEVLQALAEHAAKTRDLASARLLRIRQTLGQFLSAWPVATLAAGLEEVRVTHAPGLPAEGRALLEWLCAGLGRCGGGAGEGIRRVLEPADGVSLAAAFGYGAPERRFCWRADFGRRSSVIEADFGGGSIVLPVAVSLLEPPLALAEAVFF